MPKLIPTPSHHIHHTAEGFVDDWGMVGRIEQLALGDDLATLMVAGRIATSKIRAGGETPVVEVGANAIIFHRPISRHDALTIGDMVIDLMLLLP